MNLIGIKKPTEASKKQKKEEQAQETEKERLQKIQFIKQLSDRLTKTEEKLQIETNLETKSALEKSIKIQKIEIRLKEADLLELNAKAELNGDDLSKEQKKFFKEQKSEIEKELKDAK